MLIIYADGALLHHSAIGDKYNAIYEKKLKTEVNKAGSFEFVMPPTHALYDSLERFKTKIQIWQDSTLLFDGRVLEMNDTINNERKVYCEGNLSYLLDSLAAPYEGTMTVSAYLTKRIQEHNAQVEADKQFTLRTIDAELGAKTVDAQSTSYMDTRADLDENIINVYGGFLVTENQNGTLYLDYLKTIDVLGDQPLEFGFNLTDFTKNTPSTDVYSILLPTGDDNLTIESVNGGSKYIENATLIQKFGRIYHQESFNGIGSAAELLSEATEYFDRVAQSILTPTFSIRVADFSNYTDGYAPFVAGKKYKMLSPAGEMCIYQAYTIDYDLDAFGNTTIEFVDPVTQNLSLNRRRSIGSKNSSSAAASKRAGSGGTSSGISLKYYHEGNDSAKIIASDIGLESSSTHMAVKDKLSIIASESDYADFIENGGVGSILEVDPQGFRSISGVLKSAFGKFKGADGTAILQNMEAITQFAGNFTVDSEGIVRLKDGASFMIKKDGVYSLVGTENGIASAISQTKNEIRSDVYAANSQIYSTIQQTASSITATIEDTEQGLYSYIQQTASGIRQTFASQTNRTIVNDTDPRGETYTPKDGDIWIESVHDGTWDGADGFDWEHDDDYDWTQVQGAKVWTWKNNQWQLVADRQQLVTYSDFVNTADTLISQKIVELANEEGQIEVYRSLIEQTGERIRSEVYSATSDIYSYIHQTASSIIISVDNHAQKTYVSDAVKDGPPEIIIGEDGIARDANGRAFLDGDTWINTADQDTWDKALEWNWEDDADYNWSDLRDDEIQRYDADSKAWVPVVNGRVFTDPLEIEIADDRIAANMRSIDVVNGKVEENAHQLSVTTQELRSTFNDRISAVGSELLQTKSELRSDFYAANSQIYSYVIQTASSLTSHFENEIEDVGSSITQTASQIRSEVHASQSQIWSSITQNADSIELKVSKNGIVSAINQTAESIKISASKINLDGYVTATQLDSTNAAINNLVSGNTSASRLVASSGNFSNLEITNSLVYGGYGDLKGKIINALSSSASGGQITISSTTLDGSAGPSVNFNIADTQYYKNGVSAAKDDRSVKASNFSITNVVEYPGQNSIVFNVNAVANDGTIYTSATQILTYTGGGGSDTYTPKSYTRYGTLAYYDDNQDRYVSAGYGYWFLSNSKTLYEKS